MDREPQGGDRYPTFSVNSLEFSPATYIRIPSFKEACHYVYELPTVPGVVIADIDRTIRDQEGAVKALKMGLITEERLSLLRLLNKESDVYAVTNQWTHRGHQLARLQSKGGVRYPINPHAIIDILGEHCVFGRHEPWPTVRRGKYFKNRAESVDLVTNAILSNSYDVLFRGIIGIGDRANDIVFALKVRERISDIVGTIIPFTGLLLPEPAYEHWKIGNYIP